MSVIGYIVESYLDIRLERMCFFIILDDWRDIRIAIVTKSRTKICTKSLKHNDFGMA